MMLSSIETHALLGSDVSITAVSHMEAQQPVPASSVALAAGNGWRQALALPTTKLREDGICFDTRVSGRILWLELEDGAIWGIYFRSNGSFLSYRDLQRICQRLEEARFEQKSKLCPPLAMMFGWFSAGDAGNFKQTSGEIAEDIEKRPSMQIEAGTISTC